MREETGQEEIRGEKNGGDGGEREREWRAASYFLAKGPSATLQYVGDDARALVYAYQAQALDGPCGPGLDGSLAADPTLRKKQEAWKALNGMSREEAKRKLVELITHLLPQWKEWCKEHAEVAFNLSDNQGEADRLLQAFKKNSKPIQQSRL